MKCRPPNNRDPLRTEVDQCEPYLLHQIHLIKPKLIVAFRASRRTDTFKCGQIVEKSEKYISRLSRYAFDGDVSSGGIVT